MLQGNKKALKLLSFKAFFVVRGTGLRTCDPMHVKHVLYQLS